jgi:hypothetical protein
MGVENTYSMVSENKGKRMSKAGQLKDEFPGLVSDLTGQSKPLARVSMTVGEALEYGEVKVSATVTLTCDQDKKHIDKAGELAFFKAQELMRDGWSEMGVEK